MNNKIAEFKEKIKGKKVAVIGMGISNIPLIKYLLVNGAQVTGFDKKEKDAFEGEYYELQEMGCNFSLGESYLKNLKGFEYVFRSPGIRYDSPQIMEEKSRGAIITSEMELFFELCPCKIFAVTGSDGKTTTTSLIYLILKEAGYKCWLGGNIGNPLLDKVEEMTSNDMVVLELSSFQLHTMKQGPNVAVVTNVTPNHLDYHTSMDEYIDAKTNIFKNQRENDLTILNYDNQITKEFVHKVKNKWTYFSRVNQIQNGIMIKDGAIILRKEGTETQILEVDDILLPGLHNVENYMAAIAATLDYVNVKNIKRVATTFKGVEHRIEFVKEIKGVKFYNDSIGSSPTRTEASIGSFKEKVILIAGGYDKKIPFDDFGKVVVNRAKKLFLIGKTADKIETAVTAVQKDFSIVRCSNLEDAVKKAKESAQKGDIVILSPACASFDMYKNFEERGNHFKEIVNKL